MMIVRLALLLTCISFVVQATVEWDYRNFPEDGEKRFVKFYSPQCSHCKKLAPTWQQLADNLKGEVVVGKIDCTKEGNSLLCSRYGIRSYPTLMLMNERDYVTYSGDRSLESLISFARAAHTGKWHDTVEIKTAPMGGEAPKYAPVPKFSDSKLVKYEASELPTALSSGVTAVVMVLGSGFDKDFVPLAEFALREAQKTNPQLKGALFNALGNDLADRYQISAFPAVFVAKNGNLHEYIGSKYDWKPLLEFFVEQAGSAQGSTKQATSASSPSVNPNWKDGYKQSYVPNFEIPPPAGADCIHTFTMQSCMALYPMWTVLFIFTFGAFFGALLRRQHIVKPKGN